MSGGSDPRRHITVAAGLIWGTDGRLLVSQRPEGGSHAGKWELPGGKLEPGESPDDALIRELREELGIEVISGGEFGRVTHDYPQLTVTLIGLHALHTGGAPQTLQVADFRWTDPDELTSLSFPEANARLFAYAWRTPPASWNIPKL